MTPDHQGTADEDQQVATWTRMLQAGTLTDAGYLAMVTAWARATFERQWQQEGVVRGAASAAGGPAVVHATQLPVVSAASAPQLDQGPQEVPEDNRGPHGRKKRRRTQMTPKPTNTAVGKTSRHRGVDYLCGKWRATIEVDGKQRQLGLFADEDAAAAAYVAACRKMGRDPQNTSRHRGVSYNEQSGKWHARIEVDGKRSNLGWFADEDAAAAAYVAACREIGRDLAPPQQALAV